jgi:hypothetical protein
VYTIFIESLGVSGLCHIGNLSSRPKTVPGMLRPTILEPGVCRSSSSGIISERNHPQGISNFCFLLGVHHPRISDLKIVVYLSHTGLVVELEHLKIKMLFIIRVKRELTRVYRNGCRYNERLNPETGGSKTPRAHCVPRVNITRRVRCLL